VLILDAARGVASGDELNSAAMFILDQWRTGKLTTEKAKAKWLNALAFTVCRYKLTRKQLEAALQTVYRAMVIAFGSLPRWAMTMDRELYNELARRGACLEMQETAWSAGAKIAAGVGGMTLLVAMVLMAVRR
jgi:hypothetical protein